MRNFIICIFAKYYKGNQTKMMIRWSGIQNMRDENCINKGARQAIYKM